MKDKEDSTGAVGRPKDFKRVGVGAGENSGVSVQNEIGYASVKVDKIIFTEFACQGKGIGRKDSRA